MCRVNDTFALHIKSLSFSRTIGKYMNWQQSGELDVAPILGLSVEKQLGHWLAKGYSTNECI